MVELCPDLDLFCVTQNFCIYPVHGLNVPVKLSDESSGVTFVGAAVAEWLGQSFF